MEMVVVVAAVAVHDDDNDNGDRSICQLIIEACQSRNQFASCNLQLATELKQSTSGRYNQVAHLQLDIVIVAVHRPALFQEVGLRDTPFDPSDGRLTTTRGEPCNQAHLVGGC